MELVFTSATPENIAEIPGVICFINAKHPCFNQKVDWYREQYERGLRMVACFEKSAMKKCIGFIEYVPVESCWRPIEGTNYMMIHCLWINGKAIQHQGIGGQLLDLVEKSARQLGMDGVCTVTSDGSFMADRSIFEKHGFVESDTEGKEQLLVKPFTNSVDVSIVQQRMKPSDFSKPTMIYTGQCPWISRFVTEVQPVLEELSLDFDFIELDTPEKAQNAPSLYGSFNLIINGKIVADRNISITRLKNILKKELGI